MAIDEHDQREMRSAICYAVTQCHIANARIKEALEIDAEWWPEFERRDSLQESDLEKNWGNGRVHLGRNAAPCQGRKNDNPSQNEVV